MDGKRWLRMISFFTEHLFVVPSGLGGDELVVSDAAIASEVEQRLLAEPRQIEIPTVDAWKNAVSAHSVQTIRSHPRAGLAHLSDEVRGDLGPRRTSRDRPALHRGDGEMAWHG